MLGQVKKCVVSLFFLLITTQSVLSRPNMAPLGPSIADTGSQYYTFSTYEIDSVDQQRHYKIWVGVPKKKSLPQGYPILYLLDGNSSLNRLSETLLKQVMAQNPPVLVFIGYKTALPFDLKARSLDYTPQVDARSVTGSPFAKERVGGGSAVFRRLLENKIVPISESSLHIDTTQRALWGHSFGGLFVVDSYLHSSLFTHFFSASPSFGQGYQSLLDEMKKITVSRKTMVFMEGDDNVHTRPYPATVDLNDAVNQLSTAGQLVTIKHFPGLSHGKMFGASLIDTLQLIAQQ